MRSRAKAVPPEFAHRRPVRPLRRVLVVVPFAVLFLVSVLSVLPAFALGAPQFEANLYEEAVYATRVHLVDDLLTEGLEVKWHAEYATSKSGPWTEAGGGKTESSGNTFPPSTATFLGTAPTGQTSLAMLHHLSPSTTYYARFHAENSKHEEAERTFTFTTTAVAKPEVTNFRIGAASPTSAVATAQIESDGAQSEYHFEYAPEGSAAWAPFSSGASGTVTVAEGFATPEARITGLAPETTYCARVTVTNSRGTVIGEDGCFTTPTAKPQFGSVTVRNVTGTSAHLSGNFLPHGSETHWRFEYATSVAGPWSPVAGGEGAVSQAQAEGLAEGDGVIVDGSLAGLVPSTTYYVRAVGENAAGGSNSESVSFRTFGPPTVTTFAVHGLHGERLRIMGGVNPNSVPTSGEQTVTVNGAPTGGTFTLTFKGETTGQIAFNAPAEGPNSVASALGALSATGGEVAVTGPDGGPYTVFFFGRNGGVDEPPITVDASGLTPSGVVNVSIVQQGGVAYDTHYHFEYVSQKEFERSGGEGGFSRATVTPEEDVGSGDSTVYVGVDAAAIVSGETYRFRIVGRNTSPGNPVVDGEDQVFLVPVAVEGGGHAGACPNEAVRGGLSARLADCRAYEQLTPVEKGGAQEIFNYGSSFGSEGALPGGDGDHLEYGALPVKWGSGSSAGQSPYFFSRTGDGWQVAAGTVQPGAGIFHYTPQVFGAGLSEFAFEANWGTSPLGRAAHIEFEAGPVGGPYVTVGSVPSSQAEPGWVASSGDFSKLVLEVSDHKLLGHSTHTQEGDDLYEYSGGELREVNVSGRAPGTTIGTCGARIAEGFIEGVPGFSGSSVTSASHAVSGDGSRVFFEAVPGQTCSEAKHVYVRVNGGGESAQSVDLGAYRFLAANAGGARVLLERSSGENPGLYLYDSESGETELLPSSGVAAGADLIVSEDLSTVYIRRRAGALQGDLDVYRYDIPAKTLLFLTHLHVDSGRSFNESSPDGRYFYFIAATVAGLPGGGEELKTRGADHAGQTSQVFRYDSPEALLQCVSCASSFDQEPLLSALFTEGGGKTVTSANGDYVFFDTPAALLASDVDGQIAPEGLKSEGGEHGSSSYSLSSDVYEWRREGVDGCSHPQGCLALITSGGGGFLNILLGGTASGRDVFFATSESLLASDNDTASDIYDARIGGGFAEPSAPVACEGDACATPFAAPSDPTPSSSTFQGAGNIHGMSVAKAKPKAKPKAKAKAKAKCKAKGRRRCKASPKRGAGKARRAVRHVKRTARAGR